VKKIYTHQQIAGAGEIISSALARAKEDDAMKRLYSSKDALLMYGEDILRLRDFGVSFEDIINIFAAAGIKVTKSSIIRRVGELKKEMKVAQKNNGTSEVSATNNGSIFSFKSRNDHFVM
jgi:hypothetical protein